jgi:hypothetical protein
MKKEAPQKTQRGSFKRPPMKKEATQKTQRGSFKKPLMEKEATPKNAKGLIQNTSDEQRGNHSKSLVPHQKLANQHNNLKGVSSESL